MALFKADSMASVVSAHADFASLFEAFESSFVSLPQVPAATIELCRLRIAQLHRNKAEFEREQLSTPSEQRKNLSDWVEHPAFSDAEKACLALTEVYCIDVQAITDEHADAVKTHFGEPGLVALLQALGLYYGMTRITQVWGLPDAIQSAAKGTVLGKKS